VRIARSLAGIALGFAAFFAIIRGLSAVAGTITDAPPSGYLLLSLVCTVVGAILAGYIAARIAGAHEFPHAAAVGLLIIAMGFVSMRREGVSRPDWYQITIAGCGPISAMIGAAIRLLTKPRRPTPDQAANEKTSGAAIRR
jgi:hypothetical protein